MDKLAMKAVIYKRVSTKLQVDKYSLPAQEKVLKECIRKEGHELVGIYSDEGISGERIVDRPEFQRLLADADQKKFGCVWVIDQNRLSRGDLADLSYIKKIFKENDILIHTPYQKLTLTDIDDDFISDLFGIIAKRERLKTKQAADRGRKEKFSRGEWGGRVAPYGYIYDSERSKHLIENPEEAAVVKLITSLFLEKGYGIKRVANELNKKGLKRRSGKEWAMQSVHHILRSPTYTGALVYQKYKKYVTKTGKYRWQDVEGFKRVENAHKALIPKETFKQIQLRLLQNRSRRKTFYSLQLLTDILECSLCHNSFKVGNTGWPPRRKWVYRCKSKYAHWLDKSKPTCSIRTFGVDEYNDKVWNKVQEVANRSDLIKSALERSKEPRLKQLDIYKDELNKIVHKLDEFEGYKNNAIDLRIRDRITEAEFNKQMGSLEKEHQGLISCKKELSIKITYIERMASEGIDDEAVLRYANFLRQSGRKLDIPQKRRILEAFVSRIPIYGNGEFNIVFKFAISPKTQPQYLQPTTSIGVDGAVAR